MVDSTTELIEKTDADKQQISRRTFLKLVTAGTGIVLTQEAIRKLGISWLLKEPERHVALEVIEKIKSQHFGTNPTRAEFFSLWPYSRVWVVVNNLLAANKLNGLELNRGTEYSLIELLNLQKEYGKNMDPEKGYIAGLHALSSPPFISLVESQGLSLTANWLARTLALAPVKINEWHTHTNIDRHTRHYFDPAIQYQGNPIFSKLGTDATIYSGKEKNFDLRFEPLEDCTLFYQIFDINGNQVTLPSIAECIAKYPASLTMQYTEPIMVKAVLGGENFDDYHITMKPSTIERDSTVKPGFFRWVLHNGKPVSSERITAYYDTNGNYAEPE